MIREIVRNRFPLFLLTMGIIAVGIGYHGYSYDCFLSTIGASVKPVWGKSRCVRSDDWVVNFPIQVSQVYSRPSFPIFNPAIGGGESMDVLPPTAPTRSVWMIFKPNLWGFFLGLDTGISWEWVFGALSLILSCFYFLNRTLKVPEVESILLAYSFYFSPFFQFWSLAPALHCTYFFCLFILIERGVRAWRESLAAAYLLVAWALMLYPPFQVPLLLFLIIFTLIRVGSFWPNNRSLFKTEMKALFAGVFIASILLFSWFKVHAPVIQLISQTVYPGRREVFGGEFGITRYFGNTFFSLRHAFPRVLGSNLSEAAGFFQWAPFLLMAVWLRKTNETSVLLKSLTLFALVLILYQCFGYSHFFARLTLLSMTTENRSVIGLGVIQVFLMGSFITQNKKPKRRVNLFLTCLMFVIGVYLNCHFYFGTPQWISGVVVTFLATCVFFLMSGGCVRPALFVYLGVSLVLGGYFNPITLRGTEKALEHSFIFRSLQALKAKQGGNSWIALDDFTWGNVPRLVGAKSFGGAQLYPNFNLWTQLDACKKSIETWNRYAHVSFRYEANLREVEFALTAPDAFRVSFGLDAGLLAKLKIGTVFSPCFSLNANELNAREIPVGSGQCAFEIRPE